MGEIKYHFVKNIPCFFSCIKDHREKSKNNLAVTNTRMILFFWSCSRLYFWKNAALNQTIIWVRESFIIEVTTISD
jgi:hypothetical protein